MAESQNEKSSYQMKSETVGDEQPGDCGVQDKKPCVKEMMDYKVSDDEKLETESTLEKELKIVQNSMYIFVKRIDGKTMQVKVNRSDISEKVKAKIIEKWGVPEADLPKNWRLTYKSKTLKSGRTLPDQDIEEHCTLQMAFYICDISFINTPLDSARPVEITVTTTLKAPVPRAEFSEKLPPKPRVLRRTGAYNIIPQVPVNCWKKGMAMAKVNCVTFDAIRFDKEAARYTDDVKNG
ncbi:hypothetical protein AQUCO_02000361v1 [Aquilegia coerulea]|uniref:Ubiquitin-like domain-containing protein n=1 Tax=Aquilegia coerulea TaxID=218851 RepID=A0A2G5DH73_AQUCA|nr:hypothetical protein AQUCO_02000361v1 [Aquilegia coerulea]